VGGGGAAGALNRGWEAAAAAVNGEPRQRGAPARCGAQERECVKAE
jgi:hypothetical protein